MNTKVPVLAQAALGVVAMGLLFALACLHMLPPEVAAAGIGAVFLALQGGLGSGHAVDVKTLLQELLTALAPLFAHVAQHTASTTVQETKTVSRTETPPSSDPIPVHDETMIGLAPTPKDPS